MYIVRGKAAKTANRRTAQNYDQSRNVHLKMYVTRDKKLTSSLHTNYIRQLAYVISNNVQIDTVGNNTYTTFSRIHLYAFRRRASPFKHSLFCCLHIKLLARKNTAVANRATVSLTENVYVFHRWDQWDVCTLSAGKNLFRPFETEIWKKLIISFALNLIRLVLPYCILLMWFKMRKTVWCRRRMAHGVWHKFFFP